MLKVCISLPSPIGDLWLCQEDDAITRLTGTQPVDIAGYTYKNTPLLTEAARQLEMYFSKELLSFELPLAPKGTPFQQAVWAALRDIPYGEIRTYKQIAEAIGRPKAFRAVGQANHNNPIMIIQPCHRVVGSNGSLTGFAYGTDMKQFLLDLEKKSSV